MRALLALLSVMNLDGWMDGSVFPFRQSEFAPELFASQMYLVHNVQDLCEEFHASSIMKLNEF